MKIFGWVHRHFLHKVAKKDDDDNDKIPLLENEGFNSCACDGILAIGTLGVDLFQDFKLQDQDSFMNNDQMLFLDDVDVDDDEEMESPLVPEACRDGFDDHIVDKQAAADNHQQDDVVEMKGDDSAKVKKLSGVRITLADLLRADSEDDLFKNVDALSHNSNSNSNSHTSSESVKGFFVSKAKKKLGKDGPVQPMKKTKQLLRKMLRKKIHPDIGIQKKENPPIVVGHVHAVA